MVTYRPIKAQLCHLMFSLRLKVQKSQHPKVANKWTCIQNLGRDLGSGDIEQSFGFDRLRMLKFTFTLFSLVVRTK